MQSKPKISKKDIIRENVTKTGFINEDIRKVAKNGMCRISIGNKMGTGFFLKFPYRGSLAKAILTNEHVISKNAAKVCQTVLFDPFVGGKFSIILEQSKRYIRSFDHETEDDVTIIEILKSDQIPKEVEFFQLDENFDNPNYYLNKAITLYQFPGRFSGELKESIGSILDYNLEDNLMTHNAASDKGSSGGALLYGHNFTIIGIHLGGSHSDENINYAGFLYPVVKKVNDDDNAFKISLGNIQKNVAILNTPNLDTNLGKKVNPLMGKKADISSPSKPNTNKANTPTQIQSTVKTSNQTDLFLAKVKLGMKIYDFTDSSKNIKEKKERLKALKELEDLFMTQENVTKLFIPNINDVFQMITLNIFRNIPKEKETEESWMQVVSAYSLFFSLIKNEALTVKDFKEKITNEFIHKLLLAFDSIIEEERDYLRNILHDIYGKFVPRRKLIREEIAKLLKDLILTENDNFKGIREILEVLTSIVN